MIQPQLIQRESQYVPIQQPITQTEEQEMSTSAPYQASELSHSSKKEEEVVQTQFEGSKKEYCKWVKSQQVQIFKMYLDAKKTMAQIA